MTRHTTLMCTELADWSNRIYTISRSGFDLLDVRYVMFFLSPLLWVSRLIQGRRVGSMSENDRKQLLARTHDIPPKIANMALSSVFFL